MRGSAVLKNSRSGPRIFAVLFVTYVAYYFCRVTVPVALPILERDFGFTSVQTGLLLSSYYAVYSLSKLFNGVLGDRLGGRKVLLIGIAGSAICSYFFGLAGRLEVLALIWGLNAYFQSMGWLGIVPIMAGCYRRTESGRAMGIMSLSYQLGDFLARSSAGALLATIGLAGLFFVHGSVLLLAFPLVALGLGLRPVKKADPPDSQTAEEPSSGNFYRRYVRAMLTSPWFWVVCTIYVCLSIVRYAFWGWSVRYLMEGGQGIGLAAFGSALFPLMGSLGTLFAGWASDRMGGRRGPVLATMTTAMVGAIIVFSRLPQESTTALTGTLALLGFTLYGPYALMAGAIAIDFGSRHASATAAGIIDAIGALGVILTGVGMGYLIERFGWDTAFAVLTSIAALGAAFSFAMWKVRFKLPRLDQE